MGKVQRQQTNQEQYWRKMIRQATRSGQSIRAFCRQRRLKEHQFYRWQRRLKDHRPRQDKPASRLGGPDTGQATFALVSDQPGQLSSGIELLLSDGTRLRIGPGVEEETLRTVLAVLGAEVC